MLIAPLVQDRAFITTWNTENAGSSTKTIVIPTNAIYSYSCTVDWGDGLVDYITSPSDPKWTHVYATAGIKTVKIYGKFEGIYFANAGDKAKILTVEKWGPDFRFGSLGQSFYGCSNLRINATDVPRLPAVNTSFFWVFRECAALTTIINLNDWDVSELTTFAAVFFGCPFFNSPFSNWNTAAAISFSNMLTNCALWNYDISKLKVSNVTSMVNMLINTAFSQTNYDLLLNPTTGWPSQSLQSNVGFHAGTAKYGAGAPATGRAFLTGTKLWTITDGGPA